MTKPSRIDCPPALIHSGHSVTLNRRKDHARVVALVDTQHHCGYAGRTGTLDMLVRDAISYCDKLKNQGIRHPKVLEVGCGDGLASAALARRGALVTAVDRENTLSESVRELCNPANSRMSFVEKSAEKLKLSDMPDNINIFLADRMLHWLPHLENQKLLERVASKMPGTSKLFISVAGFSSPLAKKYPFTSQMPLVKRYATPNRSDEKFSHPVTLYTIPEITGLVESCGFDIDKLEVTGWGLCMLRATRNMSKIRLSTKAYKNG